MKRLPAWQRPEHEQATPVSGEAGSLRIRQRVGLVLPLLAMLGVAGCVNMHGLETHATLTDPNTLSASQSLRNQAFSPAAWPRTDWWTMFGDPQLDGLVTTALASQPSLRVAEARVRAAQAVAGVAESFLAPQANAAVRSVRQRFSEHSNVPKPIAGSWDYFSDGTLGANYELDFWGKNRSAFDAALGRARAAEVELQAARLLLATTLTRTYLRLDAALAQRALAQDTLRQRERILGLTQDRVAARIDSSVELTQAQAALPATREQIAALDEAVELLRNQLAALAGQGPDAAAYLHAPALAPVVAVSLPGAVPADLLGRRPDLVAQRWRVEAAAGDIAVAKAQFYPNVSLSGFVGFQSIGLSDFLVAGSRIAGIAPAVSLPLFDGGRLRANLGIRQADYDAAVEQYNATLITALHDVVDQLVSLHWLDQRLREQEQAVRLSSLAYDLALQRYNARLANYLQVLSAESQVLIQRQKTIELHARERELRLEVVRALGGGFDGATAVASSK